ELVRQFTVNMLLQYHTLMWEPSGTRTSYVDSVRAFLYSHSGEISVSLSGDVPEGMVQGLLMPANGTSGEDNWQLRSASALLLGAGSVWDAVPALIKASAKDRNESVRDAAYSAATRILRESPKDAKKELECFLAPARGERGFDEEMRKVARRLLEDVNRLEELSVGRSMPPSVPVISLNVDDGERLKGYLKLARGKGVQTSDHNYFHMIVRDIGLERAIELIMGGDCVKLTEENIPYVQDVISKIAAAAFRKEGAAAYGKVLATLSTSTLERAVELRKAKKEAINLNPYYVPDSEAKNPRPKKISQDEERKLLTLLRDAYHNNDYSLVAREAGASKSIHVLLNSELLRMDE
ncbi:MAG TPA: hypothetical protein PKJ97_04195, partial [Candidatus Bilamarchaeaceae archaeon]|nr:hypothetical protein [Candidatus Bilamarchaeaceae archaeon]